MGLFYKYAMSVTESGERISTELEQNGQRSRNHPLSFPFLTWAQTVPSGEENVPERVTKSGVSSRSRKEPSKM
ncbi:hypothetical protein BDQ12DRAFT_682507 [Crucibulum laeve]|uniref:Uncharacterized protein n=1 Tax=Crucibulum laeve TaxID=68775 RepID=A0A5C3M4K9_9AGAR|nr:hypothetical protein BDQ12DRAFT_682507 [Crucibulum laeve]